MASAYELMLVLRGRNYLSNDLRKASGDISGLSRKNAVASLSGQRQALQLRQQQLAAQKNIAISEKASVDNGARKNSLLKAQAAQVRAVQLSQAQMIETQLRADKLASTVGANPKAIQAAKLRASAAAAAYSDQAIAAQSLIEREALLTQRSAQLTDQINNISAAQTINTAKTRENELAMARAQSRLGQYGKVAESVGRTMQTFGLVITAAFAAAGYAAAKFSTGGTLAGTQLVNAGNSSPKNINRLGSFVNQGILRFMASGQSVSSASDLQTAAYNIPSGIPSLKGDSIQKAKETLQLIKEFNKVTKANYGLVDLNGVTNAGIILINTFGTSIAHLPREFDVMQSAVNRGKVTLGEFVSGLSQTAPAAKAAGYNFDAMAGTLSFLSGKLPQYTRVAVGYARALEMFQNTKFQDYMKAKGDAVTDLNGKLLPYNQIIQQILKADPALAKGGNLISFLQEASGTKGLAQARRVLTPSLEDLAGLNKATQAVPANAKGLVNASATALSQTGAVKWKELTTQFKAVVIEIGQGVIPVMQKLAKPLEAALAWFNKLSPATKTLVGEIGIGVGVIGLFGGTLLVMIGMLSRAYLAMREVAALGGIKNILGLASTAGEADPLLLAFIAAIVILVPLLRKFHTGLISVHGALILVGVAMGALAIRSMILGLTSLIPVLLSAATATGLFADAIVALELASAAEIIAAAALGYAIGSLILKIPYVTKAARAAGAALYDMFHKSVPKGGGPGVSSGNAGDTYSGLNKGQLAFAESTYKSLMSSGISPKAANTKLRSILANKYNKDQQTTINGLAVDAVKNFGTGGIAFSNRSAGFSGQGEDTAPGQVAKQAKAASFNVNTAIKALEKLRAATLKTPSLAAFNAYEKAKAALESHFTGTALTALDEYLSAIESKTKKSVNKQADAAKKAAAQLKTELADMASNAMNMYDTLLSQNQSIMGSLFSGPFMNSPRMQNNLAYGAKPTGGDYLKDLKSQNTQFVSFYKNIGNLQKRGAPNALIQELIQAGPSALPAIKALSGMGKSQWSQYIKTFDEGQKLLHQQTISQLQDQLKDYRKYGTKIADQIISGMRDSRLGLTNEIKDIIKKLFGVDVPSVTAPHKTAAKHAAKTVAAHHKKQSRAYNPNETNSHPVVGTTTRSTEGITHHSVHYHVTAPAGDSTSIKAQLRHADFIRRTRYGVTP